jgi:DNA-binding Lrp family transcriptional regulator
MGRVYPRLPDGSREHPSFAYDGPDVPHEGVPVVSAYILIQTEVGKASNVTREIGQIKGISTVDGVTGPYDVIARGEAVDLDELAKSIVMPIQAVEGVTRTLTCPVLQL